jgi:putative peptidoglycan lipid II flippase
VLYYAVGLWAFSGVRIVVSAFYSLQDTKTPVKTAVVSLLVNILLSLLLMGPMLHGGLALATSLASSVNLTLLILALRRRLGRIGAKGILESVFRSAVCAAVMGGIIGVVGFWAGPKCSQSFLGLMVWVLGSVGMGAILYGGCAYFLRCSELSVVLERVKKSSKKKNPERICFQPRSQNHSQEHVFVDRRLKVCSYFERSYFEHPRFG